MKHLISICISFLLIFLGNVAFCDENIISFDDAVKKAIESSSIIKEANNNLEGLGDEYEKTSAEEKKYKKSDYRQEMSGTLDYIYGEENYKTKESYIKIENEKIKLEKEKINIEESVFDLYTNILTKNKDIEITNSILENEEENLASYKVKKDLGKISDREYEKYMNDYENLKIDLKNKELELEDLYTKFNSLIGLDVMDRPVLMLESVFSNEELLEKEKALELAITESYAVKILKNDITLKELDLKVTKSIYPSITYIYREKQRALVDSQNTYDKSIIDITKQLEESYTKINSSKLKKDELNLQLNMLKNDLQKKENLYSIGRFSKNELRNAKIDLIKKELEYLNNDVEYEKSIRSYKNKYITGE